VQFSLQVCYCISTVDRDKFGPARATEKRCRVLVAALSRQHDFSHIAVAVGDEHFFRRQLNENFHVPGLLRQLQSAAR